MVTRASLFLLFVLLLAATNQARADADTILMTAEHFAIGGVGVAGTISPEEIAFREIRTRSDAPARLRELLRQASPAGRMYALFGLRQLEAPDYDSLAEPYRKSKTPIKHIQGCIISTEPTSTVVEWIDRYAREMKSWEKKS